MEKVGETTFKKNEEVVVDIDSLIEEKTALEVAVENANKRIAEIDADITSAKQLGVKTREEIKLEKIESSNLPDKNPLSGTEKTKSVTPEETN